MVASDHENIFNTKIYHAKIFEHGNVPNYGMYVCVCEYVFINAATDIIYLHPDILTYILSHICRIITWSCSRLVAIFVMM